MNWRTGPLSWDSILVFAGFMMMCLSTYLALGLLKKLHQKDSRKIWRIMVALIGFFAMAYAGMFLATLTGSFAYVARLSSIVFFLGSIFVFLTAWVSDRLNASLETALNNANQANEAKSLFLANISHELRTPMHGILSFARFGQLKIDTAPQSKLKSYFDEISDSGSRLMLLLNDLLDLSKLEAGKIDYDFAETDLPGLARSVSGEMAAFAETKNIKIEVRSESPELIGTFDAQRIGQVFRNLVSNAIKFSEAGTRVIISFSMNDEVIRCCVSNHGMGIPQSELETVFDKFVQSSKTKTGSGGTGLGLAISKEIIHQHRGRIWAESEPGEDTRFIVELPRTRG